MGAKKFLVVDDDVELRGHLVEILSQTAEGAWQPMEAKNGTEALALIREHEFDVVLLDLMMPGMSGMDVLKAIREVRPKAKIIMMTAFATIGNAVEAIKLGASDYISKPFKIDTLITTIRRVLEEAKFEGDIKRMDLDFTLSCLANPIRRNILLSLERSPSMRLMELCRELDIEDHTKMSFHLRNLKENDIIFQNPDKSYSLTQEGLKSLMCLKTFSRSLSPED